MKVFMLLGGLIGFSIGVAFGMAQGTSWSSILLRASIGAYLAGVLLRWWGRVWLRGLHEAQCQRLAQPTSEPVATSTRAKS